MQHWRFVRCVISMLIIFIMFVPCLGFGLLEWTRFRADFLALGRIIQCLFLPIFLHEAVKDVIQKFCISRNFARPVPAWLHLRSCAQAITFGRHERRCYQFGVAGQCNLIMSYYDVRKHFIFLHIGYHITTFRNISAL